MWKNSYTTTKHSFFTRRREKEGWYEGFASKRGGYATKRVVPLLLKSCLRPTAAQAFKEGYLASNRSCLRKKRIALRPRVSLCIQQEVFWYLKVVLGFLRFPVALSLIPEAREKLEDLETRAGGGNPKETTYIVSG